MLFLNRRISEGISDRTNINNYSEVFGDEGMSDEKIELLKAEGEDSRYSNPMIRLLLTLGYLGIFGSIITIYMIVMSALSRDDHAVEVSFMAAALIALVGCIAAVVFLNIIDKKAKKEFFEKEAELRNSAKKFDGRIVGVEKHVRHVKYVNDVFDEIIWNFKIEYFDDEKNELLTVSGERFLNDISEALAEDSVSVFVSKDGSLYFDDYKLKKNPDDEFVKLSVEVFEKDARV